MGSNTTFGTNYTFDTNGVIIPDTSDIQTAVQEEFQTALGADLSLEESTPQGRLIDTETMARTNTISFVALAANSIINISTATGTALDAWGANFNLERIGATSSTVPVLVTGVIDTVIPAGSQASTDSGTIWENESEIIIGDDGTATGTFICTTTGAVELGTGELTTIIASTTTGINGWETITNTAAATLGAQQESDASYKARILASIFTGTALFGNYASACYAVDNVTDVFTYENPYGAALTLDDITIPAHSVYVCVAGGNAEDVAKALFAVKSAGCGWCGNTTVTFYDETYKVNYTVTYEIPAEIPLEINITVTSLTSTSADLAETIRNLIIGYFAGDYAASGYEKPAIRGLISPFTIAGLLNSQISGINTNSVEVGAVTPTARAVANIIKASITSGVIWASVDTAAFSNKISASGTYNFTYNGANWQLNSEDVTLSDYGITATTASSSDPITGDIISIVFSTGELAQAPINLYCSEIPTITAENITVTVNG